MVATHNPKVHQSINPIDGSVIAEHPIDSLNDVSFKLDQSGRAFALLKHFDLGTRSDLLVSVASVLSENKDRLARIITAETGKLLKESIAEIEKCANCATYYADHLEAWLQPLDNKQDSYHAQSTYYPTGTVLGIMPFNYPFWQVFRSAVPVLAGGNTYLLKHAPSTQLCAQAIEQVLAEAGFPNGSFININIDVDQLEVVIANPLVRGVTLTGSTKAGRAVAALAGKYLKPTVLELGGSDAFVVLDDADLEAAIKGAVQGRMVNNGQSCIASKRFIVVEPLFDAFLDGFKQELGKYEFGNPLLQATTQGPMARIDLADQLADQVQQAVKAGATYWGEPYNPADGAWYHPGILTDVIPGNPVFYQELFGPVAMVFCVKNTEEAILLVNDSPYGLGACIWTKAAENFHYFASRLDVGMVYHNQMMVSDYRIPFGGTKDSGYGRELSNHGLYAFMNPKATRS
jgi:succinate-semialdehyde dehydrogenase/glutarate-semialdehyde dehydrogenase